MFSTESAISIPFRSRWVHGSDLYVSGDHISVEADSMQSAGVAYESLELDESQSLNPSNLVYNKALGTKKTCVGVLIFSTLVGIGFLILAGSAKGRSTTIHLSSFELELIPFCINILVLIATEANGYVSIMSSGTEQQLLTVLPDSHCLVTLGPFL